MKYVNQYKRFTLLNSVLGTAIMVPAMAVYMSLVGQHVSTGNIQLITTLGGAVMLLSTMVAKAPLKVRLYCPIWLDLGMLIVTPLAYWNPKWYVVTSMAVDSIYMLLFTTRYNALMEMVKHAIVFDKFNAQRSMLAAATKLIVGSLMVVVYKAVPVLGDNPIHVAVATNVLAVVTIGIFYGQNKAAEQIAGKDRVGLSGRTHLGRSGMVVGINI